MILDHQGEWPSDKEFALLLAAKDADTYLTEHKPDHDEYWLHAKLKEAILLFPLFRAAKDVEKLMTQTGVSHEYPVMINLRRAISDCESRPLYLTPAERQGHMTIARAKEILDSKQFQSRNPILSTADMRQIFLNAITAGKKTRDMYGELVPSHIAEAIARQV